MIIFRKLIAGVTETALSRFAARARRIAGLEGGLDVLITGNEEMRELNRRFRRKDKATDVLSFPSSLPGSAGDIAISSEIARDNGDQLGHGVLTELKILMLHGVLHLAGFDHENDDGQMARKERLLRRRLGLHEGLIERSAKPSKTASNRKTSAKKKSVMRTASVKTPRERKR